MSEIGWLDIAAIACAAVAAAIQVAFLVRRPALTSTVRLGLLLGLGVLPILAAGATNVTGFKATQARAFCGSCHVMTPHAQDSEDRHSSSLASIHARNRSFGKDNCYTCHADYGMYGYVMTKMGGMGHVYYYLTEYHSTPIDEFTRTVRIKRPMPNDNCTSCHSTEAPRWRALGDHASSLDAVRAGTLSCASPGCHGFAHPSTKTPEERAAVRP